MVYIKKGGAFGAAKKGGFWQNKATNWPKNGVGAWASKASKNLFRGPHIDMPHT
jgi:hypothetical protein